MRGQRREGIAYDGDDGGGYKYADGHGKHAFLKVDAEKVGRK